jgi:sugar/nucleoside kinase (ribokinase family)
VRQKSGPVKESAEKVVKDIRRATRRHFSAEDKIRIVLEGLYCRAPDIESASIVNTSGAGDSFRGALMYALLRGKNRHHASLPRALEFATDVATERCKHFRMDTACESIQAIYGGNYLAYDTRVY